MVPFVSICLTEHPKREGLAISQGPEARPHGVKVTPKVTRCSCGMQCSVRKDRFSFEGRVRAYPAGTWLGRVVAHPEEPSKPTHLFWRMRLVVHERITSSGGGPQPRVEVPSRSCAGASSRKAGAVAVTQSTANPPPRKRGGVPEARRIVGQRIECRSQSRDGSVR